MDRCAACGEELAGGATPPPLRAEGGVYHVACAPEALVRSAAEEYQAILRKGVRYFVDKYGGDAGSRDSPGARFVAIGTALEAELRRRESRSPPAAGLR
jgi:hypothetical protein